MTKHNRLCDDLPRVLEHEVHEYLRVAEVCALRHVSKPWRARVSLALREQCRWELRHYAGLDVDKLTWLTGVAEARVNARCLRLNLTDAHAMICQAAESGLFDVVALVLSRLSPCNASDRTPLANATNSDLHFRTPFFYGTPLLYAAKSGNLELVELLLAVPGIDANKEGFDPDVRTRVTPLDFAAKFGHHRVVEALLGVPNIEVNKSNINAYYIRETPLHYAARSGALKVVHLLIAVKNININPVSETGTTPLYEAASYGHSSVVELLTTLAHIEVNAVDNCGRTPLREAARNGHRDVVRLLTAIPDIEVNAADNNHYRAPLHCAASNGHQGVVSALVTVPNINLNAPAMAGKTPLHAAVSGNHPDIVELLAALPGVNVNAADISGRTPLHEAACENHREVVRLLITLPRIDVNAVDNSGRTPLHWTAIKGHRDIADLLLSLPKNDDDIFNRDHDDLAAGNPLAAHADGLATLVDDTQDFGLVLSGLPQITVNTADIDGRTPLHYAADCDHCDVFEALVAAGGDENAADGDGETPVDIAVREHLTEILELLHWEIAEDEHSVNNAGNECTLESLF